jgi:hypothetical protein
MSSDQANSDATISFPFPGVLVQTSASGSVSAQPLELTRLEGGGSQRHLRLVTDTDD